MRILIVKMSSLGDILQAFVVLQALKESYPQAQIDWVIEEKFASLARLSPHISRILPFDSRKPRSWNLQALRAFFYDVVYDLQGNCKSAIFTLLARAKQKVGFTFSQAPEWPNALVTSKHIKVDPRAPMRIQYLQIVGSERYLEKALENRGNSRLMVCFGSNWKSKQLTEETWIEFLSQIEGFEWLFIWKSQEEKQIAQRLQASLGGSIMGDLSFAQWQEAMKDSQGVISVDSCALHLAAHIGVATFSIFGPSSAQMYAPQGEIHHFAQGKCPFDQKFMKRCPRLRICEAPCMHKIETSDLVKRFQEWSNRLRSR